MITAYRFIKHLLIWLLVCLPLMLAGVVLLPLILPFVPKNVERLPRCFAWFDNYSGRMFPFPMGDGLSGDLNYRRNRYADGHSSLFWERYNWLALRNPINYFDYNVLGHIFSTHPQLTYYSIKGLVGDRPYSPGSRVIELLEGGKKVYEYYYVSGTYKLFGTEFFLKVRFGWKLVDLSEAIPGQFTQWCFEINPFKRADSK